MKKRKFLFSVLSAEEVGKGDNLLLIKAPHLNRQFLPDLRLCHPEAKAQPG